ncbi:MAG: hypothetical protein ACYTHN_19400, partial [Planctomycetota bacterium]
MAHSLLRIAGILLATGSVIASAQTASEEKIDPGVRKAMQNPKGPTIPVLLLCKTQLVEPPAGFKKFCRENNGRKRSELRKEVVAKLKGIADKEQPAIIEALQLNPRSFLRLWIVNALF